jgi:hypothetical protein
MTQRLLNYLHDTQFDPSLSLSRSQKKSLGALSGDLNHSLSNLNADYQTLTDSLENALLTLHDIAAEKPHGALFCCRAPLFKHAKTSALFDRFSDFLTKNHDHLIKFLSDEKMGELQDPFACFQDSATPSVGSVAAI